LYLLSLYVSTDIAYTRVVFT